VDELREVSDKVKTFTYSRMPVYDCDDPETWKGVVFSRDILSGLAQDQFDTQVESLCSPIFFTDFAGGGVPACETAGVATTIHISVMADIVIKREGRLIVNDSRHSCLFIFFLHV